MQKKLSKINEHDFDNVEEEKEKSKEHSDFKAET